jgi:hypothetical protein
MLDRRFMLIMVFSSTSGYILSKPYDSEHWVEEIADVRYLICMRTSFQNKHSTIFALVSYNNCASFVFWLL